VLNTVRYVIVEIVLGRKGVQKRIANECCTLMIGSVTYECRHIFNPDVMSFGGIVDVFEKQEVHVVFSFTFGAAIFHREPLLLSSKAKTLMDMEGLSFLNRGICFVRTGKVNPSTLRVFAIYILRQTLWFMSGWV